MSILWDESYNLGIVAIDEQHKKFFAILNRVSDALSKHKLEEEVITVLKELETYTEAHLAFEEKYFTEFHFNEAAKLSHVEEHNSFRSKIKEIRSRFMRGDEMLAIELISFLEGWFEYHIKKSDREYVVCFKEHGMK